MDKKDERKLEIDQSSSTAGPGDEHEYMSNDELHDKGPWHRDVHGKQISSDDFTHDVVLRISGDFYNEEQRKAYADNLVVKLNAGLIPEKS